ncbi:hypothetical protein BASA81_002584 [Batrachochytrium salamandrivorans]|nr:hypothetical protein BASA81_002584 [Batrachochytrium salamandrivorans]
MDEEDSGLMLLYEALRLRQKALPLYLTRNLRYYRPNCSPKFQSRKEPSSSKPLTIKHQRSTLERLERNTLGKRSLTVRLLQPLPNSVVVLSVFAETGWGSSLAESYTIEVSSNCRWVDVPLEYAFALRKHGEELIVLFQQFSSFGGGGNHRTKVRQIFRTDGPSVIECRTCRQVRENSRGQGKVVLDNVLQHQPRPGHKPEQEFVFRAWSDGRLMSGEVDGKGFRFRLVWHTNRLASADCREDIKPARNARLCRRKRLVEFEATQIQQVLPLEFRWLGRKQVLVESRCPVCRTYLGSWLGVLTHFTTNHDRFTISELSSHTFAVEATCQPQPAPFPELQLMRPTPPLKYVHVLRGYELYADLQATENTPTLDLAWQKERDARKTDTLSEFMLLWNEHVRSHQNGKNPVELLQRFIAERGHQLAHNRVLREQLLTLMVCMRDFGQLTSNQVLDLALGIENRL